MSDRLHQQGGRCEAMPQPLGKRPEFTRQFHHGLTGITAPSQSIFLKKRSPRQVQKNSIDRPAEEKTTRFARPIRFS